MRDKDRPAPCTDGRSVRWRERPEQGRVWVQRARRRPAQVEQRNRGGRHVQVLETHGFGDGRVYVCQQPC